MEKKEKEIRRSFIDNILNCDFKRDDSEKLIKSLSYYISGKNLNYKYNSTYLESYINDFFNMKKIVCEKNKFFNQFILYSKQYLMKELSTIVITMDEFWKCELKKNNKTMNDEIIHTGNINQAQLKSDNIYLQIECINQDSFYVDCKSIKYIEDMKVKKFKSENIVKNEIKTFIEDVYKNLKGDISN